LGVFVRDIGAFVGVGVTMLFFLSPIFYPLSSVPENLRVYVQINPIAVFVEDARRVILWHQMPDWPMFGLYFLVAFLVLMLGFTWFMKTKKAFADVL